MTFPVAEVAHEAPGVGPRSKKDACRAFRPSRSRLSMLPEGLPRSRAASGGDLLLLQVPGGEDPRPLLGNGDGVLEVGGEGSVLGVDRPVVLAHPDRVAAHADHWLDTEHHPLLDQRASTGFAEVGDLRVLVHFAPDPVAHQGADHREAVALDALLDSGGDVPEASARTTAADARPERLPRGPEQ